MAMVSGVGGEVQEERNRREHGVLRCIHSYRNVWRFFLFIFFVLRNQHETDVTVGRYRRPRSSNDNNDIIANKS